MATLEDLDEDALVQILSEPKNALVKQLDLLAEQENTTELRAVLTKSIDDIEQSASVYGLVENLFFGLSLGSVLLLAAIGLAITFGVMGVINMAHGEMMMLGAYTTYVIQQLFKNTRCSF